MFFKAVFVIRSEKDQYKCFLRPCLSSGQKMINANVFKAMFVIKSEKDQYESDRFPII